MLAFELGADVRKAAQAAVFEYRDFVRKPRQKKESDAYALYLQLIASSMKDESAKQDFGRKLLAEANGNEIYKPARSSTGKFYADGSLGVIYSLGVDMAPVREELERAISRAGRKGRSDMRLIPLGGQGRSEVAANRGIQGAREVADGDQPPAEVTQVVHGHRRGAQAVLGFDVVADHMKVVMLVAA